MKCLYALALLLQYLMLKKKCVKGKKDEGCGDETQWHHTEFSFFQTKTINSLYLMWLLHILFHLLLVIPRSLVFVVVGGGGVETSLHIGW